MVVWEALDAVSHQLELCRIDASSTVVVLHDSTTSERQLTLVRAAIARTGAAAAELRPVISESVDAGADHVVLANAIEAATVVVTVGSQRFGPLLQHAECAHLHLSADIEPHDYPPHANLRRRVEALTKTVRNADRLHLGDAHGTDLHIDLRGSRSSFDHGLLDDDHHAATFPAGWVGITPAAQAVQGTVVLMPGDANIRAARQISSPLRLQIQNDLITTIEGETPDADLLRALLEYAGDPNAYGVAKLTIGMNPGTAPLTTFDNRLLDPVRGRLAAGIVSLSFGENLRADRPCNQTISFALPNRSVQLDGLPVSTMGTLEGDFAPDVYEQ